MTDLPGDFHFEREVDAFLEMCRTATLATVSGQGWPHAANVQFTHNDKLRLYWVSGEDADHSQHLHRDGRAAITVYSHDDRAHHIHGVQMHGLAGPVTDEAECNTAWELYTAKFTLAAAIPQFRQLIEAQTFYRFTPNWARWIDNRRGFGFKVEHTY